MAAKKTLTKAQTAALRDIVAAPGKSGKFYGGLGHKATTLASLDYRRLIDTPDHRLLGRPIYGARWSPTADGRSALAEDQRQ